MQKIPVGYGILYQMEKDDAQLTMQQPAAAISEESAIAEDENDFPIDTDESSTNVDTSNLLDALVTAFDDEDDDPRNQSQSPLVEGNFSSPATSRSTTTGILNGDAIFKAEQTEK